MTQKLESLFNLPPADSTTPEEAQSNIEEQHAIIKEVDLAIDKIDAALPFVNDLDISDKELDDLSDLAKEKFQDLIDLGMNVEARFSGHILATAGTLLGHAITAKTAKINKKLKMLDLQLKKAQLDQKLSSKTEEIENTPLGEGSILDRNELLKALLSKSNNKDK